VPWPARWLAGVGASVRYGLWLPAVPSSNQCGVEGFSPRGIRDGDDYWKVVCDGKDSILVLNNGGRELQGAESTGSSPNGCGTASASSSGGHCGPKTPSRGGTMCGNDG
jgi:hypothetical protein